MEEEGLVEITNEQRESMSGHRLISIIMFKRLH